MKKNTKIIENFIQVKSWEDAELQTSGYEEEGLIKALYDVNKKSSLYDHKNSNLEISEQAFINSSRDLELNFALMRVISEIKKQNISVADVGGGNGYMSFSAKKIIPWKNWNWTVYESSSIVNFYKEFNVLDSLTWKVNKSQFGINKFDIGLLSCVLQYIPNPWEVLKNLALSSKYLIIMRLPLINSKKDIFARQIFSEGVYHEANASFPVSFFSKSCFYNELEKHGEIIYSWNTGSEKVTFKGEIVNFEGVLIKTKSD